MKVYLSKEALKKRKEIEDAIDHVFVWNCNFSGCDYTWIDEVDEIDGKFLLRIITSIAES